jgi:hypothetical protein
MKSNVHHAALAILLIAGISIIAAALQRRGLTLLPARHATAAKPNSHSWLIESWNNGMITAQHEGYRYEATCDRSQSFNNADVQALPTCDLAIDFIGHIVQGFGGAQRDAEGWLVVMWNAGRTLALRRTKDERTPWRQDEFVITSVKPISPH